MPSMPPKGPISLQGGGAIRAAAAAESVPTLRLAIVNATDSTSGPARVHPSSCEPWAPFMQPGCWACLADGSDCVANVRADERVAPGCMAVHAPLQHSLHLCVGASYDFRLWTPPADQPYKLTDLEAEVRLMPGRGTALQVDERRLAQALVKQHLGQVLAVNQVLLVDWEGQQVVARVTTTDTLDAAAQEEEVAYHCFRGLLAPDTKVLLSVADANSGSTAQLQHRVSGMSLGAPAEGAGSSEQRGQRLQLLNRQPHTSRAPSAAIVNVFCNDGEVFPVKRKLLRPCIALTSAVRSDADTVAIQVDVGTLTFDRVLIFLEAQALGRPLPDYGVHLAEELLQAALTLGLHSLEDVCRSKLGKNQSRLRVHRFEDVKMANAAGSCWLILDGMVLDVTRWLPEHPGGSTIIPAQALNIECSRFFEVYHVSRESFLYIKEFYIGELDRVDLEDVPCDERPSDDFMQQLREFTPFRMTVDEPKAVKNL